QQWVQLTEVPPEIVGFSLAFYCELITLNSPPWKKMLPQSLQILFDHAAAYLQKNPSPLLNPDELSAQEFYQKALDTADSHEFAQAYSLLKKSLNLTSDDYFKAEIHNGLGYYLLRLGELKNASIHFHKALEILPSYGFALDNLGYTYIRLGELETGKSCLIQAKNTGNNDLAYQYRNFALYHMMNEEMPQANTYFRKALEMNKEVDLLEFYYAEFLLIRGEQKAGLEFLTKAVAKGEPEAIKRLAEIKPK
ncbi:MAG: hypothetical protein AAF694_28180, partial [Bacteroidota bacterium]